MIETRSEGTGVLSLKLSANLFKSFNLTSLSRLALIARLFSTVRLCWLAKLLKAFVTSLSTVAVAFGGVASGLAGATVRPAGSVVLGTDAFVSGVATTLDSVVVGGVATSALGF